MIYLIIGIAGCTLCLVLERLLRGGRVLLIGRICHFWKYRVSKLRSWWRERKTRPHDEGELIEFANEPIDRKTRLRDWGE